MNKLTPIEYRDQRILLTSQLAERYGVTDRRISENFNRNANRYQLGRDYYCLTGEEKRKFCDHTQIADGCKNAERLYLWTEHGALLHAKSLGTDEAWEVYGELVDTYFRARDNAKQKLPDDIKKVLADAKLYNARARVSSQWMKLADRVNSLEYKQVCAHYASEVLSGNPVIPLPQAGARYYSAKEVGDLCGVSSKKVGMAAKREGLKTEEYGEWFFDKSPYSNKEVESFKYNDRALERFKVLFSSG